MLLVHPVHEVLRQLPLLVGSFVLGSATDNPLWSLLGVGFVVCFGVARWFTTTYRIDDEDVARIREGAKHAGDADPYRVVGDSDSEDAGDGDRTDD